MANANARFSRRTVIAALELIGQRLNQAELTRYILKLGPEFPRWLPGESLSMAKRINGFISLFDQNPDRTLEDGELLRDELVNKAISLMTIPKRLPWEDEPVLPPLVAALLRTLELDGFVFTEGEIRRALPADIGLPNAQDETTRLLKNHRFTVPEGHLAQALAAHTRGDWAAANAQIRSFLEGLLDDIALRLDPAVETLKPGHARRQHLAHVSPPFLDPALNEWSDNGVGFVNGLMARLHPQGSHPGLSDEEDSTFRLHTVLLAARLVLRRFTDRSPR
jgi:hypothetical protein